MDTWTALSSIIPSAFLACLELKKFSSLDKLHVSEKLLLLVTVLCTAITELIFFLSFNKSVSFLKISGWKTIIQTQIRRVSLIRKRTGFNFVISQVLLKEGDHDTSLHCWPQKRRFRNVIGNGPLTNRGYYPEIGSVKEWWKEGGLWNKICWFETPTTVVTIWVSLAKSRTSWHFCRGSWPTSWAIQVLAPCQDTWVQILVLCFLSEWLWTNYLIYLDLSDLNCKMSITLLICRLVLRMKWFMYSS